MSPVMGFFGLRGLCFDLLNFSYRDVFMKIILNSIFVKLTVSVILSILMVVAGHASESDASFDTKRSKLIGYMLAKQLPSLHFSEKEMDDEQAKAAFSLYIKQLDFQKRFLLQQDVDQLEAFATYIDDNLNSGRISLPVAGYDILSEKISIVEEMVVTMLPYDGLEWTRKEIVLSTTEESDTEEIRKSGGVWDYLVNLWENFLDSLKSLFQTDTEIVSQEGEEGVAEGKQGETTRSEEKKSAPVESAGTYIGDFHVAEQESYETDPEKITYAKDLDELRERWRKILKAQVISQYLDLEEDQIKEIEKNMELEVKSEKELWQEAASKIAKRNKNFFHRLHQETLQDHYDRFFNAVTKAFGPHTNYIPPAGKEQFDINMRGSLEGIGALLREEDGFIKVVRIIPGSASARQGRLKAEDIILQVAQQDEEPVDITDMRLRDAVRLIRGPKGEIVQLTVRKADGSKEVIPIIRDVVQIKETFVKSTVVESADGKKIGYIFIPGFYRDFEGNRNGSVGRNSTDDTRKELLDLKEQNVDGIVLDLRDNGGGALIDAVDIAGFFIESGPVVQVKNSFGDQRILRDRDNTLVYDGPVVVLVNKFSASASEIVAAALQDYGRVVVVGGAHTHGKGTVQTIINLNDNIPLLHFKKYDDLGALKVGIQKFYRVNGGSTQYKGVEPDIVLPSLFDHIKSGERYLEYSLPWDSIDPVEYAPYVGFDVDIDELRKKSLARVGKDKGFQIIMEESVKAKQRSDETSLSINIDDMREKREEARLVREKVGTIYRKYREETGEEENKKEKDETESERKKSWLKEVNEDPYIGEAVRIIEDIIQLGN